MKLVHNIWLRSFHKDLNQALYLIDSYKQLFGEQKILLEELTQEGLDTIYQVRISLTKQPLIKRFLTDFFSGLSDDELKTISELPLDSRFRLKIDLDMMALLDKQVILATNESKKVRLSLTPAAYPKTLDNAKDSVQKLINNFLNSNKV